MQVKNRKAITCDINKFCHLHKDNDFIEVTEWTNGEGFDVTIDEKSFAITDGELTAINTLVALIESGYEGDE